MYLHEAIKKLLLFKGRSMSINEIANELNKNKWYMKKDGSMIAPLQIHGRTRNYPQIFNRNGSIVYLNDQSDIKISKHQNKNAKLELKLSKLTPKTNQFEKILMNEKNFKSAATIDNLVPDRPGLYCIRIKDINKLPKPFNSLLNERNHNIIYIGIASKSLYRRFLNQELRAKGHGTFFRSIGAILGFRPVKGSLITKTNKRNYIFSLSDEHKIIKWINSNLIVNWVIYNQNFEEIETGIIQSHLPLLNLAKNPMALQYLKNLRAECVIIANS